jgi:hypothetical protein
MDNNMQISTDKPSLISYSSTIDSLNLDSASPQVQSSKSVNNDFAQYDLHNISPKEIDSLASKLRKTGDFDVRDILMLETRGAKFQSHVSSEGGREFDANIKSDLLASIEQKIEMSKKRNEPFESTENLLKLLQQIDASKSIPKEGLFA